MTRPSAYIVTGTTRGLGKALAEEIRARGHDLYSLSLGPERQDPGHTQVLCDLRDSRQVEHALDRVLEQIRRHASDALVLINNAAVLEPVGAIENLPRDAIRQHFQVNLLSPVQLTAGFIAGTRDFQGPRRIIHISSGAARNPYAGWSLYCAAKAALNSFSACVALEEEMRSGTVSICTVAPGVLDTDMQRLIRATDPALFPRRSKFVALHEEDKLTSPRVAARLLLDLDSGGGFENGGDYDLRTMGQTRPPA